MPAGKPAKIARMTANIKAIIFDYGGVLLDWNPRNLYRRYFPENPDAMEQFLAEINFMDWNAQQDKGRPFREGVAILSGQYPQYSRLIRAYHENWEDSIAGDFPEVVAILKEIKRAGYPVYGLSNWSAETFPLARRKYPFFDLFDDMVISGEVNMIKPDPAIFQLLLEKTGLNASECLLIDDSEKNISVAREMGFLVLHYQSPVLLKNELKQLGVL
jgi:2-haloacid dehalogenase